MFILKILYIIVYGIFFVLVKFPLQLVTYMLGMVKRVLEGILATFVHEFKLLSPVKPKGLKSG